MRWDSSDLIIFHVASGGNELACDGNVLVSASNDLVGGGNEFISGEQFSKWWE